MSVRSRVLLPCALAVLASVQPVLAAPANDSLLSAQVVVGCSTDIIATTTGATNDVDDLNCSNTDGGFGVVQPYGGDVFYKVIVPWSYDLHVLVEPLGDWDVSLYVVTSPWSPSQTCLVASDVAGSGFAEAVHLQNDHVSQGPREYIIGIDSWRADHAGDFRLSLTCDFAVPVDGSSFSTLKSRFHGGVR